jgi:uncharacterized membrane protein YbhN (UPF0104 family)
MVLFACSNTAAADEEIVRYGDRKVMVNTSQQKADDGSCAAGSQDTRSPKKTVAFVAKVLGSLVLLFFLLRRLNIPELLSAAWLGLAGVAAFHFMLLRVYKWFRIVRAYLVEPAFFRVMVSYIFGLGISIFTPGRIGEVARIANIGITEKSGPAGLFLLDKSIDLLIVLSMAMFGLHLLLPGKRYTLLFGAVLALAFFALFHMRRIYGIVQAVLARVPFGAKLDKLCRAILLMDRSEIARNVLLTLASYTICVFEVYFILRAFCMVDLKVVFAVHPLVMVTNVVPITFGGLGLREGASVLLYGKFGVAQEHAFWAGFLIFVFNTLLYGLLGTVLINFMGRGGKRWFS